MSRSRPGLGASSGQKRPLPINEHGTGEGKNRVRDGEAYDDNDDGYARTDVEVKKRPVKRFKLTMDLVDELKSQAREKDQRTAHTIAYTNATYQTDRDVYYWTYGQASLQPPEWQAAQESLEKRADPDYLLYQGLRAKFEGALYTVPDVQAPAVVTPPLSQPTLNLRRFFTMSDLSTNNAGVGINGGEEATAPAATTATSETAPSTNTRTAPTSSTPFGTRVDQGERGVSISIQTRQKFRPERTPDSKLIQQYPWMREYEVPTERKQGKPKKKRTLGTFNRAMRKAQQSVDSELDLDHLSV